MRKTRSQKSATANVYDCYVFQGKKRKTKKTWHKIFSVVLALIVVGVVVFFGVLNAKKNTQVFGKRAYFVCVGKFAKRGDAKDFSDKVKTAGGAGNIVTDGVFFVVAFAYPTRAQAESVAKNLEASNWRAEILEVLLDKPKSKKITSSGQKMISKLKIFADNFYSLAVSFDKNEKTEAEVQNELSKIQRGIALLINKFEANDNSYALKDVFETLKKDIEESQKASFAKNICSGDIKSFCVFALWEYSKLGELLNF